MLRTTPITLLMMTLSLVAGCGPKDKGAAQDGGGVSTKGTSSQSKPSSEGRTDRPAGMLLTEAFFPMTPGVERYFTDWRYSPKKYGPAFSPLTTKSEQMTSKWLELDSSDLRRVGDGAMYYVMYRKAQANRTLPGHGTPITYRKTSTGIVRCDSFGSANGQKPLRFEVMELKWGVRPGDTWITKVPEKGRGYSARYDKSESLGGTPCAVITVTKSDDEKPTSRHRFWLADNIGLVRWAEFHAIEGAWRPTVERVYTEINTDLPRLDWEKE